MCSRRQQSRYFWDMLYLNLYLQLAGNDLGSRSATDNFFTIEVFNPVNKVVVFYFMKWRPCNEHKPPGLPEIDNPAGGIILHLKIVVQRCLVNNFPGKLR